MSELHKNSDETTDALFGEDDILVEVQDAMMQGFKPGAAPEMALSAVNDAVEPREEVTVAERFSAETPAASAPATVNWTDHGQRILSPARECPWGSVLQG